jgi:outer membrane receptor protein involved in Fe transport
VHLGSYWLDQANTEKYGGYETFNLRMNHQVTAEFNVYARVMNLTDEKYATAAALSRGNPEFAPAMPRTFYAGIDFKF